MNSPDLEIDHDTIQAEVKVWDPLVRVFHWSLVASFIIAWVSADAWGRLHEWAGYSIMGLIALRVIWGIIGTRHARFSNFIYTRNTLVGYLTDVLFWRAKRYLGHNPAGGVMIIVLLVMLSILAGTGYLLTADVYRGVLWITKWVEEIHEAVANLTLTLVGLHVFGVLITSLQHGENLVRSMFSGRKRPE